MQDILNTTRTEIICPVAVIIRDNKIALGLRHYTPDKWKTVSVWTVPGGRCDPGETIEETLRREVKEEIGVTDLTISEFLGEHPGAKEGDLIQVFLCSSEQDLCNMEPHKFSEWRWFGHDEWPEDFINPHVEELFKSLLRQTQG